MFNLTLEDVKGRHTEEIVEKSEMGMTMFEMFIGQLSEREKAIFEIAYANGYMDSTNDHLDGEPVEVLK
ncbi:hypothetical protein ABES03_08435 [Neobacillus rhizosphaerae]|uniref:hypothetical protein n=1 Tax=Neobacillus rhizosphaerae TaxID=2880965 RepID=UPI003D28F322